MLKRTFDILLSVFAIFLLFPLFLLVSFLIVIDSGFPIFFLQKRIGRGAKEFNIIKFRTMKTNNENITITVSDDSRITRFGKYLRKTKIDELPEILNVLFGQMSFVGPRPDVKGYADKVKCPTLLATGEFDPLCPLEDAVEVYEDLTCKKELWVIEDQFHPLWGIPNLGKLDCHHYIMDWLQRALIDGKTNDKRIAYVSNKGDGPFGDCEWTPTIKPGEAYF